MAFFNINTYKDENKYIVYYNSMFNDIIGMGML